MRACRLLFLLTMIAPHMAMAQTALYATPDEKSAATQVRIPEQKKDAPVTISANEMGMDKDKGIVIARGNVEVMQGDTILTATQITYYQQADLVIAQGDVTMLQPNGDVFFAQRAELKDAMKRAVINDFKARFADNSVLVAERAVKVNSTLTTLKKASYTPCNLCTDMAPFWQMNAARATVDDDDEMVTYNNAFMEMSGIPMFYIPYLSHPTPDARGKSGLLTPSYSTNPYFGSVAKVPYYWRIDEDKDVVLTPWITTSEGSLLEGDYNQLTDNGDYHVRGSVTRPRELDTNGNPAGGHEWRGHVFAQGNQMVGDNSRVGFDIERTTDDTYLRRYGFGDQQALFSDAYYEYAQGRNMGLVSALAIQGLRSTDDQKTTPLVLPILQGYYETLPYENGMKLHVAGDAQWLMREEGVSQRRVSITPGATLPLLTEGGQLFTASLKLRQDMYSSEDVPQSSGAPQDATTLRTLPQAALEWRYPLIRSDHEGSWVLEPIALGVLQPNGGNPEEISNEDNRLLELNDTNLFSLERMPGLDLYDAGSRLAYGVRSQYYDASGVTFDGLLGQNYTFNSDTPYPNSTREGEQFSDYIGRIAASYAPVSLSYRFALDQQEATLNRNEIGVGFSKPWLSVNGSYRAIKNNRFLRDSQEGFASASLPLSDEWNFYAGGQRDLELNQMVNANSGLVYKNECFTMMFDAARTYARDRDIQPTTEFTFRVAFKNLGEFGGK